MRMHNVIKQFVLQTYYHPFCKDFTHSSSVLENPSQSADQLEIVHAKTMKVWKHS